MTNRFYGYLWQRSTIATVALLPRVRLSTGHYIGFGFGWLTAWFHVWVWETRKPHTGVTLDLLPHVWLHWSEDGSGVHLWWMHWTCHRWFIYHPVKR